MLAIRDKFRIQIEVTNACDNECTNCSRFTGHYRSTYFMKLEQVGKAIDSLLDFPGGIGIMGGEPLMHPEFSEICHLVRQKIPPERRHLHTSGYKWDIYSKLVRKTFGENVHFNNHSDMSQKHHPMLISISDVIDDKESIKRLVDNCWVNRKWCASINPKGSFFCEIAAAMDVLFEGPGGHPVTRGWWDKDPEAFQDQIDRYCYHCGACVPYFPVTLKERDVASVSNFLRLKEVGSPKLEKNGIRIHDEQLSQQQLEKFALQWQPWNHLGLMAKDGEGKTEYDLYGKLYGYSLKFRRFLRSKSWTFERTERAINTWLWRLQKVRKTEPEKLEVVTKQTNHESTAHYPITNE